MSSELLKVSTVNTVRIIELRLPDGLDSSEFDQINEQLASLLGEVNGSSWILDLTGLDYMGSAALGLLVNIRQHIKSTGGRLALCQLSPGLQKIFKTCCLERLFTIARTRDDAMRAVR